MRFAPKKPAALLALLCFVTTQFTQGVPAHAASAIFSPPEVRIPSAFHPEIPADFGSIESIHSGSGPAIFHIQEAHGNIEGQKNIQKILSHLKNQYGVNTVLLEGDAFSLKPELLRFFPKDMPRTMKILDRLAEKGIVTGPELFLAEAQNAKAMGIEDLKPYVQNGQAFVEVLKAKETSGKFLTDLDLQIERFASAYLNSSLRTFLKTEEQYESKILSTETWLSLLKKRAKEEVAINLDDPIEQIHWPMLVRLSVLAEMEGKFNQGEFEKEREQFQKEMFLSTVHSRQSTDKTLQPWTMDRGLWTKLFAQPFAAPAPPNLETQMESLVAYLPRNFNYSAYPNVNRFIGHKLLAAELKGDPLLKEIETLTAKIMVKLAKTKEEKALVELLKSYKLLKKLFALELTAEEYEQVVSSRQEAVGSKEPEKGSSAYCIRPTAFLSRFAALNASHRVSDEGRIRLKSGGKDLNFRVGSKIDDLYEKALEFYRLAKERDGIMIKNIEKILRSETRNPKLETRNKSKIQNQKFETTQKSSSVLDLNHSNFEFISDFRFRVSSLPKAVVVITGGFHAKPFETYFKEHGYSYALITPKMSGTDGHDQYVKSLLRDFIPQSSYRSVEISEGLKALDRSHFNSDAAVAAVRSELRKSFFGTAFADEFSPQLRSGMRSAAFTLKTESKPRSEVRSRPMGRFLDQRLTGISAPILGSANETNKSSREPKRMVTAAVFNPVLLERYLKRSRRITRENLAEIRPEDFVFLDPKTASSVTVVLENTDSKELVLASRLVNSNRFLELSQPLTLTQLKATKEGASFISIGEVIQINEMEISLKAETVASPAPPANTSESIPANTFLMNGQKEEIPGGIRSSDLAGFLETLRTNKKWSGLTSAQILTIQVGAETFHYQNEAQWQETLEKRTVSFQRQGMHITYKTPIDPAVNTDPSAAQVLEGAVLPFKRSEVRSQGNEQTLEEIIESLAQEIRQSTPTQYSGNDFASLKSHDTPRDLILVLTQLQEEEILPEDLVFIESPEGSHLVVKNKEWVGPTDHLTAAVDDFATIARLILKETDVFWVLKNRAISHLSLQDFLRLRLEGEDRGETIRRLTQLKSLLQIPPSLTFTEAVSEEAEQNLIQISFAQPGKENEGVFETMVAYPIVFNDYEMIAQVLRPLQERFREQEPPVKVRLFRDFFRTLWERIVFRLRTGQMIPLWSSLAHAGFLGIAIGCLLVYHYKLTYTKSQLTVAQFTSKQLDARIKGIDGKLNSITASLVPRKLILISDKQEKQAEIVPNAQAKVVRTQGAVQLHYTFSPEAPHPSFSFPLEGLTNAAKFEVLSYQITPLPENLGKPFNQDKLVFSYLNQEGSVMATWDGVMEVFGKDHDVTGFRSQNHKIPGNADSLRLEIISDHPSHTNGIVLKKLFLYTSVEHAIKDLNLSSRPEVRLGRSEVRNLSERLSSLTSHPVVGKILDFFFEPLKFVPPQGKAAGYVIHPRSEVRNAVLDIQINQKGDVDDSHRIHLSQIRTSVGKSSDKEVFLFAVTGDRRTGESVRAGWFKVGDEIPFAEIEEGNRVVLQAIQDHHTARFVIYSSTPGGGISVVRANPKLSGSILPFLQQDPRGLPVAASEMRTGPKLIAISHRRSEMRNQAEHSLRGGYLEPDFSSPFIFEILLTDRKLGFPIHENPSQVNILAWIKQEIQGSEFSGGVQVLIKGKTMLEFKVQETLTPEILAQKIRMMLFQELFTKSVPQVRQPLDFSGSNYFHDRAVLTERFGPIGSEDLGWFLESGRPRSELRLDEKTVDIDTAFNAAVWNDLKKVFFGADIFSPLRPLANRLSAGVATVTSASMLTPHTHPYGELYYINSGEALVTVGTKIVRLKAGDFMYVPANTVHTVKVEEGKPPVQILFIYRGIYNSPGATPEQLAEIDRAVDVTPESLNVWHRGVQKPNGFNPADVAVERLALQKERDFSAEAHTPTMLAFSQGQGVVTIDGEATEVTTGKALMVPVGKNLKITPSGTETLDFFTVRLNPSAVVGKVSPGDRAMDQRQALGSLYGGRLLNFLALLSDHSLFADSEASKLASFIERIYPYFPGPIQKIPTRIWQNYIEKETAQFVAEDREWVLPIADIFHRRLLKPMLAVDLVEAAVSQNSSAPLITKENVNIIDHWISDMKTQNMSGDVEFNLGTRADRLFQIVAADLLQELETLWDKVTLVNQGLMQAAVITMAVETKDFLSLNPSPFFSRYPGMTRLCNFVQSNSLRDFKTFLIQSTGLPIAPFNLDSDRKKQLFQGRFTREELEWVLDRTGLSSSEIGFECKQYQFQASKGADDAKSTPRSEVRNTAEVSRGKLLKVLKTNQGHLQRTAEALKFGVWKLGRLLIKYRMASDRGKIIIDSMKTQFEELSKLPSVKENYQGIAGLRRNPKLNDEQKKVIDDELVKVFGRALKQKHGNLQAAARALGFPSSAGFVKSLKSYKLEDRMKPAILEQARIYLRSLSDSLAPREILGRKNSLAKIHSHLKDLAEIGWLGGEFHVLVEIEQAKTIQAAFNQAKGSKAEAARLLGISVNRMDDWALKFNLPLVSDVEFLRKYQEILQGNLSSGRTPLQTLAQYFSVTPDRAKIRLKDISHRGTAAGFDSLRMPGEREWRREAARARFVAGQYLAWLLIQEQVAPGNKLEINEDAGAVYPDPLSQAARFLGIPEKQFEARGLAVFRAMTTYPGITVYQEDYGSLRLVLEKLQEGLSGISEGQKKTAKSILKDFARLSSRSELRRTIRSVVERAFPSSLRRVVRDQRIAPFNLDSDRKKQLFQGRFTREELEWVLDRTELSSSEMWMEFKQYGFQARTPEISPAPVSMEVKNSTTKPKKNSRSEMRGGRPDRAAILGLVEEILRQGPSGNTLTQILTRAKKILEAEAYPKYRDIVINVVSEMAHLGQGNPLYPKLGRLYDLLVSSIPRLSESDSLDRLIPYGLDPSNSAFSTLATVGQAQDLVEEALKFEASDPKKNRTAEYLMEKTHLSETEASNLIFVMARVEIFRSEVRTPSQGKWFLGWRLPGFSETQNELQKALKRPLAEALRYLAIALLFFKIKRVSLVPDLLVLTSKITPSRSELRSIIHVNFRKTPAPVSAPLDGLKLLPAFVPAVEAQGSTILVERKQLSAIETAAFGMILSMASMGNATGKLTVNRVQTEIRKVARSLNIDLSASAGFSDAKISESAELLAQRVLAELSKPLALVPPFPTASTLVRVSFTAPRARSEVRRRIQQAVEQALPLNRREVVRNQRNNIIPEAVRDKFGQKIFEVVVHLVMEEASLEEDFVRAPIFNTKLQAFLDQHPELSGILNSARPSDLVNSVFDTEEHALPSPVNLAPMLIYLAKHAEVRYQLTVVGTQTQMSDFRNQISEFGKSKLGFDPLIVLKKQFQIQFVESVQELRRAVGRGLSAKPGQSAVVGLETFVAKINAAKDRTRVAVLDPKNKSAVLVIVADEISALVQNQLSVYSDRELLASSRAEFLRTELLALQAFLSAA
ncbi:MAG: cupin domain-containing protein [Candidatus Omnitrophica bacterium]|nr:cupin domain-containing protein [Candidatus Omnitrophota bacterium]